MSTPNQIKKRPRIDKQNHAVKEGCKNCKKKCTTKITEVDREKLNEKFWSLNSKQQKEYQSMLIQHSPVKCKTSNNSSRQFANKYSFILENGSKISVCKTFFLTTLGYEKNNDKLLMNLLANRDPVTLVPAADKRGTTRSTENAVILHKKISDHIDSHNPSISHYRRSHAPKRLYLSTEYSCQKMYDDFIANRNDHVCSYETYRKVLKEKNISFVKLGHEECETCREFELHNPNHSKDNLSVADCNDCKKWKVHIDYATEARELYKIQGKLAETNNDKAYFSADMQKVIMLPRLDSYKIALFTRRLVTFNESFVPIGSPNGHAKPLAVLWNESIAGRKQEQLVSTFHQFFIHCRDYKKIVLWLDNCSAQNKSWDLITFFVYIVNSGEIEADEIEIFYFEPGHTFMSCDSFHHSVELSMKKRKNIYDFKDFVDCVSEARANIIVKKMEFYDFRDWRSYCSQSKLNKLGDDRPYLNDVKYFSATKGKYSISYSKTYNVEDKQDLDFLLNRITKSKNIPVPKTHDDFRGVTQSKKKDIIDKLCPLMPKSRQKFWKTLPESDKVPDLISQEDDDES